MLRPGNDLLKTNASCNAVPLPERLYAGGANSLRGFRDQWSGAARSADRISGGWNGGVCEYV